MDKTGFVKVLTPCGDVIGNGFLLDEGLVATCAHVLRDALGVDPKTFEPGDIEGREVSVEFHWAGGACVSGRIVEGSVVYDRKGKDLGFVKVDPPVDATPLRLSRTDRNSFPASLQPYFNSLGGSLPVSGQVIGRDENNRLILKVDISGELRIEPGNSGAAVFLRDSELVEALLIQRDRDSASAFLMPALAMTNILTSLRAENLTQKVELSPTEKARSRGLPKRRLQRLDALIDDFCGPDPVAGFQTIPELAEHGPSVLLELMQNRGFLPLNSVRLRDLTAAIGHSSIPVLRDIIANRYAVSQTEAAEAFEAFAGDFEVEKPLLNLLQMESPIIRERAVIAAGFSGYAAKIVEPLTNLVLCGAIGPHEPEAAAPDSYSRFAKPVMRALARGFGINPHPGILQAIDRIASLGSPAERDYKSYSIRSAFPQFTPLAVNVLIEQGFAGDDQLAQLAMEAIGATRFERFSHKATQTLTIDASENVKRAAIDALTSMGGVRAATALNSAIEDMDDKAAASLSMATLFHHKIGWPENVMSYFIMSVAPPSLTENRLLMRLRQSDILMSTAEMGGVWSPPAVVSTALAAWLKPKIAREIFESSTETMSRAAGGLAVAILEKSASYDLLLGSDEDASTLFESILLLCAQMISGDMSKAELIHQKLYDLDITHLMLNQRLPFWRYIILACLKHAGPTDARANAWARQWRDTGSAVERQIDDFRARIFFA